MKILLSGDTTTTTIARMLEKNLSGYQVTDADFNSWIQQSGNFHNENFDYWIQVWSPRTLTDNPDILSQLDLFLAAVKKNNQKTKILATTFVVDPVMLQPLHQQLQLEQLANALNQKLFSFAAENSFFHVMSQQSFFITHGLKNIHDDRFEAMGRMYFSPGGAKLLADYLARGIKALSVTPKKVLVLDLDNTLWGGIIGEDGIEGIKLGGEGAGFAFSRFQRALLKLKENGIILAISSKNNEEDALNVFKNHPDMILKLEDFAAMRINWGPKGQNIIEMAQELNLGVDSFVFFDDSSFERENVAQLAPAVTVIDVPKDPNDYILSLNQFFGFDTFVVTEEDKKRARLYNEEAKRNVLKKESGSLDDFYKSLQMKATLSLADEKSFARIHQLIMKTNQFNLTTKRYEESELKALLSDKNYEIILLRLQDKMGESGITGITLLKKQSEIWEIENLMLSCRIITRTVEFALMRKLCERAKNNGAKILRATFIPSERNQVAANYLSQAGFTNTKDQTWEIHLSEFKKLIPQDFVETTWTNN